MNAFVRAGIATTPADAQRLADDAPTPLPDAPATIAAARARVDALTVSLRLTEIDVPAAMLAYHATRTVELARLIRAGKPIAPLSIVRRDGRYVLIEGKDELAAWRLVGAGMAPVRVVKNTGSNWRERRLKNQ
jgi:hypothetical protein